MFSGCIDVTEPKSDSMHGDDGYRVWVGGPWIVCDDLSRVSSDGSAELEPANDSAASDSVDSWGVDYVSINIVGRWGEA